MRHFNKRFVALFLFTVCLFSPLWAQRVTLNLHQVTVKQAIATLKKQSGYSFVFYTKDVNTGKKIDVNANNLQISQVVDQILAGQNVSYDIKEKSIVVYQKTKTMTPVGQQNGKSIKASGRIIDNNGEPVIGATVLQKGTRNATVTDIDGRYSLDVPAGSYLEISYVGYKPMEIRAGSNKDIVMEDDAKSLNEVVVVGFGSQRKIDVTGSISTVSSKTLTARPINRTIDALLGVVPGLNLSYGSLGGALDSQYSNINIRGTGTIGTGSTVAPLILIDGSEGNMNTVNPQDIENISVLKDAASASIYGSRAPGGVILITTKRGKAGKPTVNYSNNFRINSILNMPQQVDSYTWALATNEYRQNNGETPYFTDEKLQQIKDYMEDPENAPFMYEMPNHRWGLNESKDYFSTANTNWLKELYGTHKLSQEHNVSISGGSDQMQYRVSGSFLNRKGLLRYGNDRLNRYTMNGRINAYLAKWMMVGYSLRFTREDLNQPQYAYSSQWNNFIEHVYRNWPNYPFKDPNGHYTDASNVYNLTNGGRLTNQQDDWSQQLSFIIEPIKNWKTSIELNYRTMDRFIHTEKLTTYGYDAQNNQYVLGNPTSSDAESAYKENFFNPNIYTEYSKQFESGHYFKAMLGFQCETFRNRQLSGQKNGVLARVPSLDTSTTDPVTSGYFGKWATEGYFGRLNYNYKERYMAEFNLRYDGTSRFLKENRWNWLPSFSLGWNVAKEAFFENLTNTINNLKFRFSYGTLGNQNTDNWYPMYRTISMSMQSGKWLVNGQKPNISSESALISSTLTWEKIRTTNFGLDLSMFRNRLNVNFDYFIRKSIDMVGPGIELPYLLGIAVPKINNLDMTSRGFELEIGWRDRIKDFVYSANLTLSDHQITIDKYPNESKTLASGYYEGEKLGEIWGYQTVGIAKTQEEMDAHLADVDQSAIGSNWGAGDIMYADLDGDHKISRKSNTVDDHGDVKILGNSTPRYVFGLDLNAAYKGFDLKVFFQGVLKRDLMPASNQQSALFWGAVDLWHNAFYKENMDFFRTADSPLGENLDAYYPKPVSSTRNRQPQSRYLQNAAYCRLKNLTLGYTLPNALTRRFYVQNLRFFISAENVLTITKLCKLLDPETAKTSNWSGETYPLQKTFSFGMNITL